MGRPTLRASCLAGAPPGARDAARSSASARCTEVMSVAGAHVVVTRPTLPNVRRRHPPQGVSWALCRIGSGDGGERVSCVETCLTLRHVLGVGLVGAQGLFYSDPARSAACVHR